MNCLRQSWVQVVVVLEFGSLKTTIHFSEYLRFGPTILQEMVVFEAGLEVLVAGADVDWV